MPSRTTPFFNDSIYHLLNRGVEQRQVFINKGDYQRFINLMSHYQIKSPPKYSLVNSTLALRNAFTLREWKAQGEKIVHILCYCLMPNHFHLLIRQVVDGGITKFMSQIQNSYTRFFNTKYERIGPLFQGRFKAILIKTDEQLIHVSRYIHLNPFVANLIKEPKSYHWSSYKNYLKLDENSIEISKDEILDFFKSPTRYHDFVMDYADYARSLELLKHEFIDY